MERLFNLLESLEPSSESFKDALRKEAVLLSLPRNHMLLEAAKVAEYAYFIASGFAMSYRFVKGRKQIEEFYRAGRILVSPRSFFEQTPSTEFIQLLEPSEVFHIRYESVMMLLKTFPVATSYYWMTMTHYYEESRQRIHDLQHLSAGERYKKLHQLHPRLEQLVPQEFIASYLGIAPQSLSRLKRNGNV
jgi:CRP/FNR family transcriptional regulator, anaerobic regulatory protein